MELVLKRIACKPEYTIGKLYIDNQYFCDTIEDTDRGLNDSMSELEIKSTKVYYKTAIPIGKYDITLEVQSPRFCKRAAYRFCDGYLPRLKEVKGFDGVLIHIGNHAGDSAGCILVGQNKAVGQVLNSTTTFKKLYAILLKASKNGEKITIKIEK